MKHKLNKYLNKKSSIFDNFREEIIFLHKNDATQKSILKFLKDNGTIATQSNLSKWISRHAKSKSDDNFLNQKSKNQKTINVKKNVNFDVFKNLKGDLKC